jgi:serine/threonine protein kinase
MEKEKEKNKNINLKNNKNTTIKEKIKKGKKHTFTITGTSFTVDERFEFIKQIGLGAYGIVISCLDKKTNNKVAIKKVPNAFEDLIDAKRILREIKLLRFFEHENIISLLDVPKAENKNDFNDIYIITDLMETDLHRVIYSKQELTDEHIQYFVYQILRATLYIHSSNVVHRDLKPSNILANKNCDLKICDLGLGRGGMTEPNEEEDKRQAELNTDQPLTEYVITRWYRAPEVILCPSEYSKAVDIWSIGCIFSELLGRNPLFPGDHYLDQIQKIISVLGSPTKDDLNFITNSQAKEFVLKLPKRTKQQFSVLFQKANPLSLDLLSKMLVFNPYKRYTIEQCLAHPYFEGLHNSEEEPISNSHFDWKFDDMVLTRENIQCMINEEAEYFHQNED